MQDANDGEAYSPIIKKRRIEKRPIINQEQPKAISFHDFSANTFQPIHVPDMEVELFHLPRSTTQPLKPTPQLQLGISQGFDVPQPPVVQPPPVMVDEDKQSNAIAFQHSSDSMFQPIHIPPNWWNLNEEVEFSHMPGLTLQPLMSPPSPVIQATHVLSRTLRTRTLRRNASG